MMKKITLLLFATLLFLIPTASAQIGELSDNFALGNTNNWSIYTAGAGGTDGWEFGYGYVYHEDDNPSPAGSSVDNYLITPLLDLSASAGDVSLSYRERGEYNSYYTSHTVIYSTDYDGSNAASATWTLLREGAATTSWVTVELSVPNTATAIAFRYQGDYSDWWLIDDVEITPVASCGDPTDFVATVSDFSFGSASFSWTAGNNNDSYSWSVYEGTDTTAAAVATGSSSTANDSVTGLSDNQLYTVVISATCSGEAAGNTLSGTFTTNHLITGAHSEDFSSYTASASNNSLQRAYSQFTGEGSWYTTNVAYDWVIHAGSTGSGSTGPNVGGTDGSASDVYLYTEASNVSGTATLETPYFDLSSMSSPRVAFDYHMYGATMGDLTLYVVESDGTETSLVSYSGQTHSGGDVAWLTATADLANYMSEEIRFKFTVTYGGSFTGDAAIDDFTIEETPGCEAPSAFSGSEASTQVALSWTAGASETEWQIEYGASGFTEGTGTTVSGITSNSYTFTGLTANTAYDFYVAAVCDSGNSASTFVSVTTWPTALTTGFSQNFDSSTDTPSGWTISNGGGANAWTIRPITDFGGISVSYDHTNSVAIVYNGTAHDDNLYTPPLVVSDGVNDAISFRFMSTSSFYPEKIDLNVVQSDGTTTTIADDLEPDNHHQKFYSFVYDLSAYEGEEIRIAFHISTTDENLAILDNVVVGAYSDMQTGWAGFHYSDTSWSETENWYSGNVPTGNVTISEVTDSAANYPSIESDISATGLTIESNASLTIAKDGSATVSGDFTNNGTVTMNSDANEFSSLIVSGTATGDVTYNRYVNAEGANGWDLIGSPVDGQSISDFVTANSGVIATSGVYSAVGTYDNSDDSWENYGSSAAWESGDFELGTGYQMATTAGATMAFTGSVVTSDQTSSVVNNHDNGGRRWNLVSNPFTSFVNANDDTDANNNFLSVNEGVIDNQYLAAYGWDADGTGYTSYGHDYNTNTAVYMAPGQAFMIAANADSAADLSITSAMQTVNGTDDFISGDVMDATEVYLRVYNGDEFIEDTHIKFQDEMTFGLDPGYDLGNYYQDAAISTRLLVDDQGTNFAHQQLPVEAMDNAVIPLVINQAAGQEFRINLHTATIPDPNVYLEDIEEGTFTNLYEGDFVYTPTSDLEGVGRFFIHMTADTMSNEEVSTSMLNAYKEIDASYITIEGLATQTNETKVSLYNILGREVLSTTLNNNMGTQTISTVGLSAGIYVIELESGSDRLTKKLLIQ